VPIVVQYTTNVGSDEYDEVVSKIRLHDDPPEGLIMHTAAVTDEGQMRVFDVWRFREAYDRFAESRLRPAIIEVVGEQRAESVEPQVHQLHSLVKPVGT
jgi:hypothetical protein